MTEFTAGWQFLFSLLPLHLRTRSFTEPAAWFTPDCEDVVHASAATLSSPEFMPPNFTPPEIFSKELENESMLGKQTLGKLFSLLLPENE